MILNLISLLGITIIIKFDLPQSNKNKIKKK